MHVSLSVCRVQSGESDRCLGPGQAPPRREYQLRLIFGVPLVSHSQHDANQIVKMKKRGPVGAYVSPVLLWACKWNYRLQVCAELKLAEGKSSYRQVLYYNSFVT